MPAWKSYILISNERMTPQDIDNMPLDEALDYCEILNVKQYNKAMSNRAAASRAKQKH